MALRFSGLLLFGLIFCLPAQAACVGIIPAGADHQFWEELVEGAEKAAAESNLRTYTRAPSTESNELAQVFIVEATLKEGCTGILLAPSSSKVLTIVSKLNNSGVPVVYVDRDMGGARVSIVKTDNYRAGGLAAQKMAKALGGRGKVALLRMREGVRSTSEREDGFRDWLETSEIEIVHDVHIGSTVGQARENTFLLMEGGFDVDGVFTPNESSTIGAMISLKKHKSEKPIHHIGFDYTPVLAEALSTGNLSGLIVQQPYQIGYQGMKTLIKALNGQPIEPAINIPVFFIGQNSSEPSQDNNNHSSSKKDPAS